MIRSRYAIILIIVIKLDQIDRYLIQLLRQNSRQSSAMLALNLNMSASSIRRRIRRLLDNGVVKPSIIVHTDALVASFMIVFALDVAHESLTSAVTILKGLEEIRWLTITSGRFDVICIGRFESPGALSAFLEERLGKVKGILNAETFFCLRVQKDEVLQA